MPTTRITAETFTTFVSHTPRETSNGLEARNAQNEIVNSFYNRSRKDILEEGKNLSRAYSVLLITAGILATAAVAFNFLALNGSLSPSYLRSVWPLAYVSMGASAIALGILATRHYVLSSYGVNPETGKELVRGIAEAAIAGIATLGLILIAVAICNDKEKDRNYRVGGHHRHRDDCSPLFWFFLGMQFNSTSYVPPTYKRTEITNVTNTFNITHVTIAEPGEDQGYADLFDPKGIYLDDMYQEQPGLPAFETIDDDVLLSSSPYMPRTNVSAVPYGSSSTPSAPYASMLGREPGETNAKVGEGSDDDVDSPNHSDIDDDNSLRESESEGEGSTSTSSRISGATRQVRARKQQLKSQVRKVNRMSTELSQKMQQKHEEIDRISKTSSKQLSAGLNKWQKDGGAAVEQFNHESRRTHRQQPQNLSPQRSTEGQPQGTSSYENRKREIVDQHKANLKILDNKKREMTEASTRKWQQLQDESNNHAERMFESISASRQSLPLELARMNQERARSANERRERRKERLSSSSKPSNDGQPQGISSSQNKKDKKLEKAREMQEFENDFDEFAREVQETAEEMQQEMRPVVEEFASEMQETLDEMRDQYDDEMEEPVFDTYARQVQQASQKIGPAIDAVVSQLPQALETVRKQKRQELEQLD